MVFLPIYRPYGTIIGIRKNAVGVKYW